MSWLLQLEVVEVEHIAHLQLDLVQLGSSSSLKSPSACPQLSTTWVPSGCSAHERLRALGTWTRASACGRAMGHLVQHDEQHHWSWVPGTALLLAGQLCWELITWAAG